MPEAVITVEDLFKRYLIAHDPAKLGGLLPPCARRIGRKIRDFGLKSFGMQRGRQMLPDDKPKSPNQGEGVGIISAMGLGNGVLLKI